MLPWLLAIVAGLAAAGVQYGRAALAPRMLPLALLRAIAVAVVVALLLDARAGAGTVPEPEVALDASESWTRAGCTAWRQALDSARHLARGRSSRFGEALREDGAAGDPTDRASSLRPLADRAAGSGRPVTVITDGELDDGELIATLPRGSRAIALSCAPRPDVAVASLDAPRALLAGDTVTARVTLIAGGAGGPAGRVELRLDDVLLGAADVAALGAFAERAIDLRGVAAGRDRTAVLRAIYRATGDAEPRNDTLALGADVTRAAAAVFVSTAPDYDAREAVAALRGVTSLPTRAYYRVAPGAWRTDGTLAHVDEGAVRAAVQAAPLVVLHGDTSVFGAPRGATRASLLLFAPPANDEGEWFAAAAPPSPLASGLGALPLDSLPPLNVAPRLPTALPAWQGLVTRRAGAPDDRRVAIVGWDEPRRVAVIGASGFWRWRFRGGVRADAYAALFGGLYDWLAAGRGDRRAVVPEAAPLRAGAPLRWRRGAPADSTATVTLRRRGATARVVTATLHFPDGTSVAESPTLPPGIYDATMAGGTAVVAVNQSRELIPRRATVRSGSVGGAATIADPPSVRELGWLYGLAILVLCAEWMLRRRAGLR
jgi:hypothetical protein